MWNHSGNPPHPCIPVGEGIWSLKVRTAVLWEQLITNCCPHRPCIQTLVPCLFCQGTCLQTKHYKLFFARAAADHSFDYLLLEPTSAVSFMLLLASTVTVAKRCFPCHGNRLIYADYGASGVDNSRGGIDGTCLLHPEHKRMLTVTWPNRARMHYMLLQGR